MSADTALKVFFAILTMLQPDAHTPVEAPALHVQHFCSVVEAIWFWPLGSFPVERHSSASNDIS